MDKKYEAMAEANKITHKILEHCKETILNRESISKIEVETLAEMAYTREGLEPAFKGVYNYPSCICISINDEIVHGVPKEQRIVKGDLVSLDFGVKVNGYNGDAAISFINNTSVSNPLSKKRKLVRATKEALDNAVLALQESFPNCKISDIVSVMESYRKGYGIVEGYGGHGIGKQLHDSSIFVPNTWSGLKCDKALNIGDYFTIEPMFTLGKPEIIIDGDGYTIKTADGSLAAHFEYTLTITKNGVVVLK